MYIELTANVSLDVQTLIDMDRLDFLAAMESALGSPIAVDNLNYNLIGTYGRQELTFAVRGTVDEDELNAATDGNRRRSVNEVQAVWNAWLETHPACQQEIEGLRAASARPLLILTCVAEVLTGEPHTTFTSGEWHRFTRVAREYGWATRNDGVESAPSSISAALWEGKWGVDLLVTPATIEATLNAPSPACRRDMPKELVKVAHLEWGALYRPMRGARLNGAVASMVAAAEVAAHELIPRLSHEALSPVKMYRLLRSDEAKNAFIREWMRSGEFLTSSSEEFAWIAAEHSLRSDADSLAVLEHFTVNGEVLRPLVAAAYSSDPYVARWLTFSTHPWLETFVPS